MKLALRGVGEKCGYGNLAAGLAAGLAALGVEVVGYDDPAPASLWVLPPHFLTRTMVGRTEWMLNMWEADNCPEGLYAGFGNFDGILVPTEMNLSTFSPYHPNVHRVDVGVDWRFWTPVPRDPDGGPFRWLYTAHSPIRKGGDVALRAGRALSATHDVEMVEARAGTDADLRDLYYSCHGYVQPSRGEGWGMMPHQALATGMPTVISDCPGHREYGWLPGCYLTPTRLVQSSLSFNGDPGMWCEPDLEPLVDTMRWVMDNYAAAGAAASGAPALCEERYDWDDIAQRVVDLIGADVLAGPDPKPTWKPATFLRFPVEFTRTLPEPASIGGASIRVVQGDTAHVTADQKRVLTEAGLVAA